MPFALTIETQNRFKSHFDKSTDEVMNTLLDAYEQAQNSTSAAPAIELQHSEMQAQFEKLKTEINNKQALLDKQADTVVSLQDEINSLKQQNKLYEEQLGQAEKKTQDITNDNKERLESAQKEAAELHKTIADHEATIKELEAKINELSKENAEVPDDYKELKDRVHALEDHAKEDRRVIDNYREVKKELEKVVEQLQSENKHLKTTIEQMQESGSISYSSYPEGDILHFFSPLCARLVEEVCQRLTEEQQRRNPDVVITPQIMLGDMFLKYIIQRYNTWFFRPMLSDNDIVRIVQEIAPDIQSIRQLKKILGIRD